MQSQKNGLVQLGVTLVVFGVAVNVALLLGRFIQPFAGFAIIGGIVLSIIGLVMPRR